MQQRREIKEQQKNEARQLKASQALSAKVPTDSTEDNVDSSRKIKVSLIGNLLRNPKIKTNLAQNLSNC